MTLCTRTARSIYVSQQETLNRGHERSKMRVVELRRWILLTIVLAFPVLVWGQNDNDMQDNSSPRQQSQCEVDGTCPPADYPSSITLDDTRTSPDVTQRNRMPQSQQPGSATYPNAPATYPGTPATYPSTPKGARQPEFSTTQIPRTKKAPELTDFQDLVYSSVGTVLPIYGESLFENVPTTFAPVEHIPVTSDYVIGPGDELLIRGWGQLSLNVRTRVDRNGNIFIPEVGNFYVAGVKYEQLQPFLKAQVGRVFQNFDLSVSLGELRSIDVFVVGQAKRPGRYTVSSLSTMTNALFASGGPLPTGSMRRIQLKRGSGIVMEFDLYDLLLNGDKSKDMILSPEDVIYIPPAGPQVAISGQVNVPAIYELKKETDLAELLRLAGGLSTTALGDKVWIERIDQRHSRRIEELALDYNGLTHLVKDGDVVTVDSISPRFENAVTLRGNIARPGRYPWRPGMRVSDLIPSREFLITREYWKHQNQVANLAKVEGQGGKETLQNYVKQNAPEINWDYAVIQRMNQDNLSTQLIPFNLAQAVLNHDESSNLPLQAGDIVTVFSQADLRVPKEEQTKFIRLEGEFKAAGVYRVEPGHMLRDIVQQAGGLASAAYLYGSIFTRETVRIDQQERLNTMVAGMERDILRQASLMSQNIKSPEEVAAAKASLEAQRATIAQLRQLKADGRIVLDLAPTARDVDMIPNIALEDGDRFYVPSRPAVVSVIGDVYNQGAFLQKNGKTLSAYLQNAGGPTRDADKGREFVYRANGTVISKQATSRMWTGGFDTMHLMPGDTVVVPEQVNKGAFLRGFKDWSQILSNFGLAAAAINVLK
jgi:polysaccharide biosynthesis/export protein